MTSPPSNPEQRAYPSSYTRIRCASLLEAKATDESGRAFKTPNGRELTRVRVLGVVVFHKIFEPQIEEAKLEPTDMDKPKPGRYGVVVLDDGTETLTIKAWRDRVRWFDPIKIGDTVEAFGQLNLYQGELSLIADFVVKISDPNIELLRETQILDDETAHGIRPGGPIAERTTTFGATPSQKTSHEEDHGQEFSDELTEETSLGEEEITDSSDEEQSPQSKAVVESDETIELRGKVLNAIIVLDVDGAGVKREDILEFIGSISRQQLDATLNRLIEEGDIYMPKRNYFKKV